MIEGQTTTRIVAVHWLITVRSSFVLFSSLVPYNVMSPARLRRFCRFPISYQCCFPVILRTDVDDDALPLCIIIHYGTPNRLRKSLLEMFPSLWRHLYWFWKSFACFFSNSFRQLFELVSFGGSSRIKTTSGRTTCFRTCIISSFHSRFLRYSRSGFPWYAF